MLDLTPTLAGKSEQLRADDLLGGDKIITILRVAIINTKDEQQYALHFDGDHGRPYKPCLTMRKLLSLIWGSDGESYQGRQLLLYRDAAVRFGTEAVGGIRIKAASHIDSKKTFRLSVGRGKRGMISVEPLASSQPTTPSQAQPNHTSPQKSRLSLEGAEKASIAAIKRKQTLAELEILTSSESYTRFMAEARDTDKAIVDRVTEVLNRKLEQLQNTTQSDPIEPGRWPEEEMPA